MTSRPQRAMALALAGFLLLWLGGLLMLGRPADSGDGLRQLWQMELGPGYHLLANGSRGGVYVSSVQDGQAILRSIETDGSLAWQQQYATSVHRQDIQEFDDMLCIMGVDGKVQSLDYDGELQWDFQPDVSAIEELAPQPDSPEAQLYCRSGVLVYGLDLQGTLCWVVNTGQDKIFSFRDPGIHWNGRQALLVDDSHDARILFPDGSMQALDFRNAVPAGQNPALKRTRLKLATQIGDRLLLTDGSDTVLMDDSGGQSLGIVVDRYASEKALQLGTEEDGRIMIPLDKSRLAEFDQAGNQLGSIELHGSELQRSLVIGDRAYALLLKRDDQLTDRLLHLARIFPLFEDALLLLCGQDTKGNIKGTGMHLRLQVVRDGNLAGKRDLGTWQWQLEYPQLVSDGQLLYLLFNGTQLSCYAPGLEK